MTLELDVTEGEALASAQLVKRFGFHHAEDLLVIRGNPGP